MAKWDFTVTQKRILTKIISSLQREIGLLSNGASIKQLELFSSTRDSIHLEFSLNGLVKNSNNYSNVKKALLQLRGIDVQIILPETKSKKSKLPEQETILTGLIERAVLSKYSRTVRVMLHKATAYQLIKTSNGLTQFAEEVMYLTNNRYTQKLYEMISQWKDQEVFSISPDDFRERFLLIEKYPLVKDLIKRVIKPAEIELKRIGDVYFEFKTTIIHKRISKFNFIILHRKSVVELEHKLSQLRNDNIHLLKSHLGLDRNHLMKIDDILSRNEIMTDLRRKIIEIHEFIGTASQCSETAIKNVPQYVVACLMKEFLDK